MVYDSILAKFIHAYEFEQAGIILKSKLSIRKVSSNIKN